MIEDPVGSHDPVVAAPPPLSPLTLAVARELVTRFGLQLARDGDGTPAALGGCELLAVRSTGARALVAFYPPAADGTTARQDLGARLTAVSAWVQAQGVLGNPGAVDVLLVALGAVELPPSPPAPQPGLRLSVIAVDPATAAVTELAAGAQGIPTAADIRRIATRLWDGEPAPTLAGVQLAARQQAMLAAQLHPAADASRPGPAAARSGGAWASWLAIGLALLKYGVVLLKSGTLLSTLLTMAGSIWLVSSTTGLPFAVGLVGLFLVHEVGHMVAAIRLGIPVSTPMFLGPFGAFVRHAHAGSARAEAEIAVSGPAAGALVTCAVLAGAVLSGAGSTRTLLLSLAQIGFLMNVLNLAPVAILDGRKVVDEVAFRTWTVCAAACAGCFIAAGALGYHANPLVAGIGVFCGYQAWSLRGGRHRSGRAAAGVNLLFAAAVVICAAGATATAQLQVGTRLGTAAGDTRPGAVAPESTLAPPGARQLGAVSPPLCTPDGKVVDLVATTYWEASTPMAPVSAFYSGALASAGWQGGGGSWRQGRRTLGVSAEPRDAWANDGASQGAASVWSVTVVDPAACQ